MLFYMTFMFPAYGAAASKCEYKLLQIYHHRSGMHMRFKLLHYFHMFEKKKRKYDQIENIDEI